MPRRLLFAALVVLATAIPAAAQTFQNSVDITFDDGAHASGYFVYESTIFGIVVRDWAILVSGGDEATFPPVIYDPTTGTATFRPRCEVCSGDFVFTTAPPPEWLESRQIVLASGGFEGTPSGAIQRQITTFTEAAIPGPTVILTVNGNHPATRIVGTAGEIRLQVFLAGDTFGDPLDWYWALWFNGTLYWVTAAGISNAPAPLLHVTGLRLEGPVLLDQVFPVGTTLTSAFIAVHNGSVVGHDVITAVVVSPR